MLVSNNLHTKNYFLKISFRDTNHCEQHLLLSCLSHRSKGKQSCLFYEEFQQFPIYINNVLITLQIFIHGNTFSRYATKMENYCSKLDGIIFVYEQNPKNSFDNCVHAIQNIHLYYPKEFSFLTKALVRIKRF